MTKNRRVIVIGGSGFIGSALVRNLSLADYDVIVIDRRAPSTSNENVRWVQGDGLDAKLVLEHVDNGSVVIYLGGNIRPATKISSLAYEIEHEIVRFVKLAEACAKSGVEKFIFASSGGTIYGKHSKAVISESDLERPEIPYAYSKLMAEHALRLVSMRSTMSSIILRITNPFGPGQVVSKQQGFIAAAMAALFNREPLHIWGDGTVVRDFVFIEDVANAFLLSIAHQARHNVFNIGSGFGASLNDVCGIIQSLSTVPLEVVYEKSRIIDLRRNVLSNRLALKVLGWQPEVSLRSGIDQTLAWWVLHSNRVTMACPPSSTDKSIIR